MSLSQPEKLLTRKELAAEIRRNIAFVYAMEQCGFLMPGGRCTLTAAINFLTKCPRPYSKKKPIVVEHNRHD